MYILALTPLPAAGEAVEPITTTVTADMAGGAFPLMWVLLALPALGAAVLLLGGRRTNAWGHLLGCLLPVLSFILALVLLLQMMGKPVEQRLVTDQVYSWVAAGSFVVDFSLRLDQLSMAFVLLITGVGSLIHIYSIGYMAHDPGRRRFFGMMNLFVASMLLLVMADNYLLLYVGWEGVGLASFLLIGFWQYKDSAAVAAKKAFVMNRVGDAGLSVAIMLMFATFGTVAFQPVFDAAPEASENALTVIGVMMLLAAVGKSAQFPLQAWLLDAMEGPTPVSALIHAATMVTAGVYLIVRSNAIFDLSNTAVTLVLAVGVITMLVGAIIACAKDDIKKSLAGSTMSQIGYMFLAAGLGPAGYVFAIFHLLMHGMFKADLFLSAGSVIHGMRDEQDMRRFGGLRTVMLITTGCFVAGFLGISGIPPFDSFFSKDDIIAAAMGTNVLAGICAVVAAGITAFYMSRMVIMTFFGDARWDPETHPHESPPVMTVPMIILSVGALFGGLWFVIVMPIEEWLAPVTGYQEAVLPIPHLLLEGITLAIVAVGIVLAWRMYGMQEVPQTAPQNVSPLTVAARNQMYDDAFNETVFMRPGQYLTRWLVWFENRVVDGAVRALAGGVAASGNLTRRAQTGFARSYALTMVAGAVLVGAVFVAARWV